MVNQLPVQSSRQTCGNLAAAAPILTGNRDGTHSSDCLLIHIHGFTSVGYDSRLRAVACSPKSSSHKVFDPLSVLGVMYLVERTSAANARSRVPVRSRFLPRAAVRCTLEWSWHSHHSRQPPHLLRRLRYSRRCD